MGKSLDRQMRGLSKAETSFSESKREIESTIKNTTELVQKLKILSPTEFSGYLSSQAAVLVAINHLYRVIDYARNAREQAIDAEIYEQACRAIINENSLR